jgi:hypothetical protein
LARHSFLPIPRAELFSALLIFLFLYFFLETKRLSICMFCLFIVKMEEDVEPKDEDGVDGRGVAGGMGGWVVWVWWAPHPQRSAFFTT